MSFRARRLSPSLLLAAAAALFSLSAFATDIPQDILKQRDPFKMPPINHEMASRSDLETYPADQYKLVGILAGASGLRAMLASPNGKTYFVRAGMLIGTHKGAIRKITENAVIVREKIENALGELENVDTVIKLPADAKQDVRTTTLEQGW